MVGIACGWRREDKVIGHGAVGVDEGEPAAGPGALRVALGGHPDRREVGRRGREASASGQTSSAEGSETGRRRLGWLRGSTGGPDSVVILISDPAVAATQRIAAADALGAETGAHLVGHLAPHITL